MIIRSTRRPVADRSARRFVATAGRRGAAAAVSGVLALSALVACSSDPTRQASGGATADTSVLNMYLYQKPKTFSPLAPNNGPDLLVMSFIFDPLFGADANYALSPKLAAGPPEVSEDAKTFTFTLRPGLKWSDGQPLTAKDVVFTYNALADPATGSAQSGKFAAIVGAKELADGKADTLKGVTAPDDTTVKITTSSPSAGLVGLIGNFPILPQHVLGGQPAEGLGDNAFFTKPTVASGAFTFVQYKTDQYVELAANPAYRQPVSIKKVFLKPVTSDVATAQLGTGEMDLAMISATDLPSVQRLKDVKVVTAKSPGFTRLAVDQTQKRFKDARVRQALLTAIDRKGLVDKVIGGAGTVIDSSFYGDLAPADAAYAYDPAKAKSLLAEAGWDSAKPVSLSWVPGQRDRDTAATVIQSQLQAVGVNVELKQVQVDELLQSYEKRTFDLALFGGGNYATEPSTVSVIDACDQGYPVGGNISHFCDKSFDELMAKADTVGDQAERKSLFQQAAKLENAQVPYLWLYNPDTIWAYRTRLSGFEPSGVPTNEIGFWDFANWKLGSAS
ncbi:ABC transporter substrate-binding protein [Spongiactinospora sp. TRM90649]|uniref:ABC transporter substrate-binding protein n=1 Tax=Spongiactinospora sp. TRM90649 TaxID=3031114 RepID=UPI0023F83E15|nr:ABC transporter substrate-binding protein [Spongiactinospora sp. TRM90649]MDF5756390.1 ABC transporter substrate-binding protein [Spongiactinospora sp. TRM90649]